MKGKERCWIIVYKQIFFVEILSKENGANIMWLLCWYLWTIKNCYQPDKTF